MGDDNVVKGGVGAAEAGEADFEDHGGGVVVVRVVVMGADCGGLLQLGKFWGQPHAHAVGVNWVVAVVCGSCILPIP